MHTPGCLSTFPNASGYFHPCFCQNELAILELIHVLVEAMDRYFDNVVRYSYFFAFSIVLWCALPSYMMLDGCLRMYITNLVRARCKSAVLVLLTPCTDLALFSVSDYVQSRQSTFYSGRSHNQWLHRGNK